MNSFEVINIAEKFVNYLQKSLSVQGIELSMTNAKGIIIASSRDGYIGKFCIPAMRAIASKQTLSIPPENSTTIPAVNQGIYIPLSHSQQLLGALVLEGSLAVIEPLAPMCTLTANAFFETEFYKEAYWGKLDQRNIFTKILLYCEEDPFPSEVHHITEKFSIDPSMVRVPILFILRYNELTEEKLINEFKKNPLHSSQDIICITRGQNAVVFKALSSEVSQAVSDYRQQIELYVNQAGTLNINSGKPFICTTGSLQNNLLNYHRAFRHSLWVCNNCADVTQEDKITVYYFYDYVFDYIEGQIDIDEGSMIFNVFHEILLSREWDSFGKNMGILLENNMNISSSAKELYLHRNTLINWLNRYKQIFGVDPINDKNGRDFTQQLYYFYTHALPAQSRD